MSKPNWEDAPEWAKFVAQDRTGAWFWYEQEPSVDSNLWRESSEDGRVEVAFVAGDDWTDTLERRP